MTSIDYMTRLSFPAEAVGVIAEAEQTLLACEAAKPLLTAAKEALFFSGKGDFEEPLSLAAAAAKLPRETADMAFLVACLPALLARYRERGVEEPIFWHTMRDLTYKLRECDKNRGIWGTFVTFWYPGFYRMERFGLGRLQFEKIPFPYDGVGGLRRGDTVYNCHIPSSGPLTPREVDDALSKAKAFFGVDPLPVYCDSWLLYPPQIALYDPSSNLRRFAERFTILSSRDDPHNGAFWRVCDRPWAGADLEALPEDTALRRALKAWLKSGHTMGIGAGLLWA